jgi:hypothetical protein
VAGCYQCVTAPSADPNGIGVCRKCSCLGCPYHGGYPGGNQSRFLCTRCLPGTQVRSAAPPSPGGPGPGGPGTPGGPGSGGPPGGGGGGGAASESAEEPRFTGSLDWQARMPLVAEASAAARAEVDLRWIRRGLRSLFGLLDDEQDRRRFLANLSESLREPVADQVARMATANNAYDAFEERGGEAEVARHERELIVERFRGWLETSLRAWMAEIHPVVNEEVWLGAPDAPGGVIDALLVADAVGLNCWAWSLRAGESPFRRLDAVGGMDTGLAVITELYALAAPATAGAGTY